jgi:hypothetical protein
MHESTRAGLPKLLFFYVRRAQVPEWSNLAVERRQKGGLLCRGIGPFELPVDDLAEYRDGFRAG